MRIAILIIIWFLFGLSYLIFYGDEEITQHDFFTRLFITFMCLPVIVIIVLLTITILIFSKGDE